MSDYFTVMLISENSDVNFINNSTIKGSIITILGKNILIDPSSKIDASEMSCQVNEGPEMGILFTS